MKAFNPSQNTQTRFNTNKDLIPEIYITHNSYEYA